MFTTKEENVLSVPYELDKNNLDRCNHEETDTRFLLHSLHASNCGFKHFLIKANDTDVTNIDKMDLDELWITFGSPRKVNDARQELFWKYSRQIGNLHPTEDALKQHVLRATLQGGQWTHLGSITCTSTEDSKSLQMGMDQG